MVAKGEYVPSGAARDLFFNTAPEILIEGPAGTGKTRAVLEKLNFWCLNQPGIRAFMSRATRVSMTESVLVEFEDSVLDPRDRVKPVGGTRPNRTAYEYPNGSYMVVAGLDNADRIMSSQYDIAAVFEATEITESDWDKIQSRLRHNRMPYQQSIADCNPSYQSHWLNRRADRKGKHGDLLMSRLLSRHEDNPTVTKDYLQRLDNLSGARYERLRLGRWVDESGVILPEFDSAVHVVPNWHTLTPNGTSRILYYVGGIDWGYTAPGCFQVWGVTDNDEMYRVEEVYYREKKLDWWAEVVEEAYNQYDLRSVVCDPAEPENIGMLNDRLTHKGRRDVGSIAVGANNRFMAGRDLVAELLKPSDGSAPRMYFCDDAFNLRGIDKSLREDHLPYCSEDEIPGITWDEAKENRPIKERPKPGVPDHAFDVTRYVAMHLWSESRNNAHIKPAFRAGSYAEVLGWESDL